jgi:Fe-S cluster assembly ATPase SufC
LDLEEGKMEVNRQKVHELMKTNCAGNYNRFARELGVDPSHLYRFLNTGVGGGKKILMSVIKYCKMNGLDFEEYISI